MLRLYRLQSGFVTSGATHLTRPDEEQVSAKSRLYVPDFRVQDSDNFYDEEVNQLFTYFHNDPDILKDMAFRENAIRMALRVFNTQTLDNWIKIQTSIRGVGYLHRRFLVETLEYLKRDQPRKMEPYNYYKLLSAEEGVRVSNVNDFSINECLKKELSHYKIDEMVVSWTSSYRRFADMLESLQVIFGRRVGLSSVSNRK